MKEKYATDSYDIIRRPIITEKATLASENNTIAFEVSIKSTKKQIKGAIEDLFNVKVESVNTLIVKGKVKRYMILVPVSIDILTMEGISLSSEAIFIKFWKPI